MSFYVHRYIAQHRDNETSAGEEARLVCRGTPGLLGLSTERYYSEKQPVKNVDRSSKTWCKLLLSPK